MYDPIMDNSIHQMSSPFIGDVLYPSLKAYVFNFFKLVTFISRRLNIRFSNRLRLCIQMFPTLFSKSSLLNLSTSPIALFLSGNKVFDVFYQYLEYLSMHLLSYGIVKISGYDEVPY